MFTPAQFNNLLLWGTAAFVVAAFWGYGIRRAFEKDWTPLVTALTVSVMLGIAMVGFGLLDDLLPSTTWEMWLVVGFIFVIVLCLNVLILPLLARRFSEQLTSAASWAGTFLLFGVALFWLGRWGDGLDASARGSLVVFALVLGLFGASYGVFGYIKWVRG